MARFELDIAGKTVSFSKTVSESDVYLFAGITGDLSPNHVDEKFMRTTPYGGRIAHGALLVGYMSRGSTMFSDLCTAGGFEYFPVSLGYDRIRFLKAVRIGDTITVTYRPEHVDQARLRTTAHVEVTIDSGEIAAVASHIMKWISRDTAK